MTNNINKFIASDKPIVLHLCHGYESPFTECARHYVTLFKESDYRVLTVFIVGKPSQDVANYVGGDEVIFLNFKSKDLRGLKLRVLLKLRRLLKDLPLAFCIAHRSKPTWLACLITQVPVISIHHAFGDYRRPLKRLIINCFRKRLMMIGVSKAVEKDLRSFFPNWPEQRIATIHNRIDYKSLFNSQYCREEARSQLGLAEDDWLFATAGRLHPMKDQQTLIQAFAKAHKSLKLNSKLLILGKGKLEQSLKKLARDLGVSEKVLFLGFIPEANRYFKAFDCFILSSNDEPFGMVLLEAMTAGIPVISSESGGSIEVIGEIGKSFPVGCSDKLASLMLEQQKSPTDGHLFMRSHDHLKQHFSDKAARETFWQLPGIQKLLHETKPAGN
ncbi:MAG: glycosyltransferase [Methylophaga sp.]|nr:glycosyltransferase [Methylophaga sp.]